VNLIQAQEITILVVKPKVQHVTCACVYRWNMKMWELRTAVRTTRETGVICLHFCSAQLDISCY